MSTDSGLPTPATATFSARLREPVHTLVVGCGNLLRGDDAVGPVLIRHLWARGLPAGVRCADGGTGGMDVAFQMRGVPRVVLIDACTSGNEPGAVFRLPGELVERLPPLAGLNLHAFRWDHALAFARWLLKDEYPRTITVYLIEAASLELGAPLSAPVEKAMQRLADLLLAELAGSPDEQIFPAMDSRPGHQPRHEARHES